MIPQKKSIARSFDGHGNRRAEEPELYVPLVILMQPGVDGKLKVSRIRKQQEQSSTGSDPVCLVAAQITGEESRCGLALKTSSEKTWMD